MKIQTLKVKSFVTALDNQDKKTVNGGARTHRGICAAVTLSDCPNISQGAQVCSQDSC